MSSGPDGFTHGLIWEERQDDVPQDALLLRIEFKSTIASSWGFRAEVVDGPMWMQGRVFRFMPERVNSCVGLGAKQGFVVVRKEPVSWPVGVNGKPTAFLSVLDYQPSWLNEILRFFGGKSWQYPGERGSENRRL